jgi:hypothetical protein
MKNIQRVCAVLLCACALPVFAQVQSNEDVALPSPKTQGNGGITPWFNLSLQSVFGGGINLQNGAAGFGNYGGNNNTYASFNVAFVQSQYDTPKVYEVGEDPEVWGARFKLLNFTSRIDSWEDTDVTQNRAAWLAEITGKGVHIGFFTQAGALIGSMNDNSGVTDNNPRTKIIGGNTVLALGDGDLGSNYYESADSASVTYTASNGGLLYGGYEMDDLFKVYLTLLSEGNVNSDVSGNKNDGIAGVINFNVTPLGTRTDDETPFTLAVDGNVITGARFGLADGIGSHQENPFGFGIKAAPALWLGGSNILRPVIAFDGRSDDEFTWKFGIGVTFQFSGGSWVSDEWNELEDITNGGYRYENNKIYKYAYAQVYAAYSEADDFDLVFKLEEPDGVPGFSKKLGALLEWRLYNLGEKNVGKPFDWEAQGRVSYDITVGKSTITPYLRAFYNKDSVTKLRIGAQANVIPHTGFELAYTSANLNPDAKGYSPALSWDTEKSDKGRVEFIVILKMDDPAPKTPKRMGFWNYKTNADDYTR